MKHVSIVVPIYKAEQFLQECIDSLLSQSYQDWELILVDDGSPDNSGAICDDYASKDGRIKVIHQKNGGVTAARKAGVLASSGEWIFFVDADDKVTENGLQALADEAEKDDSYDIIEGSYIWFYPDGTSKERPNIAKTSGTFICDGHTYAKTLYFKDHGARGPVSKIIRKSVILKSNALLIPRQITNREDAMMLTSLARHIDKYKLICDDVYYYRNQFCSSASSNKLSWSYWVMYLQFMHDVVLQGVIDEWFDVWQVTAEDVFKIAFHGQHRVEKIPNYIRDVVIPDLMPLKTRMPKSDQIMMKILRFPAFFREPLRISIQIVMIVYHTLFGQYYALKSRK